MDEREEIKSRIDIVDLINGYFPLKQSGRSFKACCPFHNEKTPSFMVNQEKQMWHCFGSCADGGDIFAFIMKMEGLDFYSALKMLADKAGVELKRESKDYSKIKDQKDKYFSANEFATDYYEKALTSKEGKKALDYLKKRGLIDKTVKEFRLGYAPKSTANIVTELKKLGFKEEEIIKAGVAKKRDGKVLDYFWDRIMFPISDHSGSVVGFSARTLSDEVQPKYLNTTETDIYHKSKVLYGMDKAKVEIRRLDHAILVEGNMDVIASYQAGVKNVIAVSGTAFTDTQLGIIKRFTKNIKLAFDIDVAGSEATKRAIEMAMQEGFNVKVVVVPDGKDPADAIEKDKNLWIHSCKGAKYVIDYLFSEAFSKNDVNNILGKKAIARELLGVIKKIPETIEQEHYIKELSEKISVSEESLRNALQKVKTIVKKPTTSKESKEVKEKKQELIIERLLGLILYVPEYQNFFLRNIKKEDLDEDMRDIYEIIEKKKSLKKVKNKKADLMEMKAEAEFAEFDLDRIGEEVFFLTKRFKQKKLSEKRKEVQLKLKEAESSRDDKKVKELIRELNEILKEETRV